ncbi:hypothetical protein [Streptosporangium subroseum]|uniref:hypothetical protein n=1 Tax=Streptosporangium subroseum TaxID=106412 RepID=UPI00117D5773|nr:hypothetical protein [Streptosporangium subroseum]
MRHCGVPSPRRCLHASSCPPTGRARPGGDHAAAQISRWAPLGDALARLGRNTLPVYIIHMPLLALLHQALLPALSTGMDGRLRLPLTVAEPLPMTALLVWLCLTLRQGLLRSGATWLFDLPERCGPGVRHALEGEVAPFPPAPIAGGHTAEFPTVHAQSVSGPMGPTIARQESPPDTERV